MKATTTVTKKVIPVLPADQHWQNVGKHVDCNSYQDGIFHTENFKKVVKAFVKELRKFYKKEPFDAIVFMGVSGSILAGALSLELGIPIVCVRKDDDNNHSSYKVTGPTNFEKYIIVDDLISSGATVETILYKIRCYRDNSSPKCVGIFLYNSDKPRNIKTEVENRSFHNNMKNIHETIKIYHIHWKDPSK